MHASLPSSEDSGAGLGCSASWIDGQAPVDPFPARQQSDP